MQAREFIATVTNHGHLPDKTRLAIDDLIRGLAGKRVKITVALYQKRRSNNQNAYYFGVVVKMITQMFRDNGNSIDEMDCHEFLKLRVGKLAQVFVTPDGEVIKGLGSTARLTTTEFNDYIEKCRAFAAEYDVSIPLPNEY